MTMSSMEAVNKLEEYFCIEIARLRQDQKNFHLRVLKLQNELRLSREETAELKVKYDEMAERMTAMEGRMAMQSEVPDLITDFSGVDGANMNGVPDHSNPILTMTPIQIQDPLLANEIENNQNYSILEDNGDEEEVLSSDSDSISTILNGEDLLLSEDSMELPGLSEFEFGFSTPSSAYYEYCYDWGNEMSAASRPTEDSATGPPPQPPETSIVLSSTLENFQIPPSSNPTGNDLEVQPPPPLGSTNFEAEAQTPSFDGVSGAQPTPLIADVDSNMDNEIISDASDSGIEVTPPSKKKVQRGKNKVHGVDPEDPSGLTCRCGDKKPNKKSLTEHLKYHTKPWKFKCGIGNCAKVFARYNIMMKHAKNVHKIGYTKMNIGCRNCGLNFPSRGEHKRHLKLCLEQTPSDDDGTTQEDITNFTGIPMEVEKSSTGDREVPATQEAGASSSTVITLIPETFNIIQTGSGSYEIIYNYSQAADSQSQQEVHQEILTFIDCIATATTE